MVFDRRLAARVALYAAPLACAWGAYALNARLARRAAGADAPYERLAVSEGAIGSRSLAKALVGSGSTAAEAAAVSRALWRAVDPRRLRGDETFSIARTDSGAFLHLTFTQGLRRAVVSPGGRGYRVAWRQMPLLAERRRAAGTVRGSLWQSMEAAGVPGEIIVRYAEAYEWTVDFLTEPREGDSFAVVWSERRLVDGRPWDRVLEAGMYKGSITGQRLALRFGGDFYDQNGESLQRMFLRAPLRFTRISSRFTGSRRHPILRISRPHHGTDYAAPRGTPVSTVADGVVVEAARERGFGNVVRIRHNETYTTLYGHLQGFASGVRKGMRLKQGRVIGFVGATGLATGPHLHFQIQKNGKWADFLRLNLPFAKAIASSSRGAFAALRGRMLAELEGLLAAVPAYRPRA